MKRICALLVITGVITVAMLAYATDYYRPRLEGAAPTRGSSGGGLYFSIVDSADTDATGGLLIQDTMWSDTIDISTAKYLNVVLRYESVDTGSTDVGGDTVRDTFFVMAVTSFGAGTAEWTMTGDTLTFVGDSARFNKLLDTCAYTDLYFVTIYKDSFTAVTYVDTNEYILRYDVLLNGTR